MEENLKKHIAYLPYLLPVIYFLGFIVINGYLNNFAYKDYTILNVNYLKAGVLYLILLSINFINVWFYRDLFNQENIKIFGYGSFVVFQNTLFLSYLILSYFLNSFEIDNTIKYILIGLVFLYVFLRITTDDMIISSKNRFLFLEIPGFAFILVISVILIIHSTLAMLFFAFNFIITVLIIFSFSLFFEGKYKYRLLIDFIVLFASAYMFGNKIYGEIPYIIGGGQPYEIATQISFLDKYPESRIDTFKVLYENDESFVLKIDSSKMVVKRENLDYFYLIE